MIHSIVKHININISILSMVNFIRNDHLQTIVKQFKINVQIHLIQQNNRCHLKQEKFIFDMKEFLYTCENTSILIKIYAFLKNTY